jgi:hypothetical protein
MLSRANTLKKLEALKPVVVTWAQQMPELIQSWNEGLPTEEIAARLGRSVSSVLTQAVRAGLPRRTPSGRKPQQTETVQKHRKLPVVTNIIAFPRAQAEASPTVVKKARSCLMCGTAFQSRGAHNRICQRCKCSATYQCGHDDGYALMSA